MPKCHSLRGVSVFESEGGVLARVEARRAPSSGAATKTSRRGRFFSYFRLRPRAPVLVYDMQGYPSSQAPHFRGNMSGPSSHPYTPNAGAVAVQAAAAALSNPYAQFQYPQAPHYAQAYAQLRQPGTNIPGITADGYTLSSTYVPGSYNASAAVSTSARPPVPQKPSYRGPVQPHWYQPGDCRCTKVGCPFTGSKKAVEIHMMDRHLIYPPGWDKQKKKDDWDADPSLKGCALLSFSMYMLV